MSSLFVVNMEQVKVSVPYTSSIHRVADPHQFNADPYSAVHFNLDPDPAFYINPDPDPASNRSDGKLRPLDYRPSRTPF